MKDRRQVDIAALKSGSEERLDFKKVYNGEGKTADHGGEPIFVPQLKRN